VTTKHYSPPRCATAYFVMLVPVKTEGTAQTLIPLHQTTRRHDSLHRHYHDTLCSHRLSVSGLLYKLKVLSVCVFCAVGVELGHQGSVTLHVMLPTCCWFSFISLIPSCLSVGLQRPSVCRHGADINAAPLQTCRKRRKYYFCLLLSLLTQSDLYCYQRQLFY
jgi:hypothetical protein